MKIKDAQAGLILRDVIVTEISLKNSIAVHGRFNENMHIIDMDYNVVEVDDSDTDSYTANLELITKVLMKDGKTTIFNLKIKHLGYLVAPKKVYPTTDEFIKAVELNGLASLVSFARANITTITSAAFCQGNLVLPMINIFKLQKLKEESIQGSKNED